MTIDSEKNIVTGKDIYIEDAKKDFLSNVNFIGDTTQETEDPIQWKEAQGNNLHLTDISLTEVKDFNVLGDSKQEEIEAVEGKSIEGEYITVTDADLSKEFSLEYLGNSKQEQREGYNKIKSDELIGKKVSEVANNNSNLALKFTENSIKANIEYIFKLGLDNADYTSSEFLMAFRNSSNTSIKTVLPNKVVTFTENEINLISYMFLYWNGQGNVENKIVTKCMLVENKDINKPQEQYGATPSIEIPSEIENVKTYNLFDKNNVINDKFVSSDIVPNTSWCYYETSNLSINKKYIVNARTIFSFYNEDTNISYLDTQINFDIPISIPENTTKVYISIQKTNLENFMLVEEKDKDKPYTPYGAISIGLGNKNILPITYTKGQHIDSPTGITIDFIEKNRIKLNGTATRSLNLNTITGATFTWKKGKTYSLQLKIIEGSYSTQPLVLHTGFKNEFKNIYNNLQADISNNFKRTITIDEDGYSDKCIIYANSGVVFNNLIVEIQLEENTTTTEIVVPQEQNYNLHINDLELNGINDIRDSFVVEVDNSYSYKKIKKLFLKRKIGKRDFSQEPLINDNKYVQGPFIQGYYLIFNNINSNMKINNLVLYSTNQKYYTPVNPTADSKWQRYDGNFIGQLCPEIHNGVYINYTIETKQEFVDWFNNLAPTIIYPLENPELIDLTETYPELVQDIETIMNNMELYEETTHLYTSGNLVIKLNYNYITPSPSINRPSEIENLTGDVDVEVGNKNIIKVNKTFPYSDRGLTYDYNSLENKFTLNGTALSQNIYLTIYEGANDFPIIKQNEIISVFSETDYTGTCQIELMDKDSVRMMSFNSNTLRNNVTIPKDVHYIRVFFSTTVDTVFNNYIKLDIEKGDKQITEITPHQSQTYPLHLGDLELNGLGDIRDSFVVKLDNSYSNKKINNLYLNKKFEKYIINNSNNYMFEVAGVSELNRLYAGKSNMPKLPKQPLANSIKPNWICDKFKVKDFDKGFREDNSIILSKNGNISIVCKEFISKEIAKNLIEGTELIYEIETPELIDLTETYPQLVEDIENILNNIELYEDVTNIYIDGLGEIYIKYDGYDGTPALKNPSEVFNITGEQTVTITNTNKFNLLNYQLPGTIYEKNGITFIMNNDGTIDLYGYADEDAEWYLVGGVDKNYDTIMSFDSEYTLQLYENKDSNVFIYLMNDSKVIAMTNLKDNFSYNGDIDTIMIRVNKGTTVDTTIYPILTEETEQEAEEREEDYTKANQQLYKIRLKDLELNGDNNVRDTFEIEFTQDDTGFKNITKLYHNKNFNKYIFTGEENVTLQRIQNGIARFDTANIFNNKVNSMLGIYCNYLKNDVTEVENTIRSGQDDFISTCVIYIDQNIANNAESLKVYLKRLYDEENPMYVIYQLANTEKVLIQDEDLIQDLENLLNAVTYEGVNKIKSTATVVIEYTVKYKDNYDFYIDENDKFFCVPQYGIKFLFSPMESNIPEIAEATESTVKIANKDGDLVLSTTYEPISLDIVCYTDENLDAKQKIAEISKVTRFLDSIKYKTKKIALLSSERMFPVKYNKNLTPTRYPKSIRFSIPLKSSKSYSNVLYPTKIFGNGEEYSNTIRETGCIITIYGPAQTPIIYLNGYEMKYDNVILDGNKLIIDTGNSTVTHVTSKDVRTNAAIYYNHEYPKIQNGINKIEIKSGIGYDKQVITEWYDLKL